MPVLTQFSTITEMFDTVAQKFLNESKETKPVLMHKVDGTYKGISYAELKEMVEMFALGLASLGVQRGDTIALVSENRPEWVVADLGMTKLGAVNVSIYPTLTPKQIEFILNDAEVKLAIVSNQLQLNKIMKVVADVKTLQRIVVMSEKAVTEDPRLLLFSAVLEKGKEFGRRHAGFLQNEIRKVKAEDLLTLIYTSGTTGNPKGVMLSHGNLVSNIKATVVGIPFTHDDILLSFLPLCHSYERMAGYYTAMACGATIAYAESIETVRENLLEVRPTVVTTVPRLFERIYHRLMKQIKEAPRFRRTIFDVAINVGREYRRTRKRGIPSFFLSLQCKIADKLVFSKIRERTGGRIRFFASGGAALSPELGKFFEAVGIQIIEGYGMTESSPVISVNRLDDYKFGTVGKPIPSVEVKIADDGEILVRGPNVMMGYWKNPQATKEAIDDGKWLHTGDIGLIDDEGFLKITDRKKDLFVSSGGKNIAPQHIENLFLLSELIDQFVLIGDGKMFLTALIVPSFGLLKEYASKHSIIYQDIEHLVNTAAIYRYFEEEVGKIQKDLANYERVRKFTLLSHVLTIETGELAPTLKVRRKVVEERYKHLIDKMYDATSQSCA
ncbi:MAG: long-chain fatty acid--CoA ligase [Ignavibacteria bacterium]|nr:long-chain fatty acid--CoA ligase [Ignavibacteria bacterium]MBI3765806.1 long-chain fatty acid--CoA ligase [Ignavibacteriales bacterium]